MPCVVSRELVPSATAHPTIHTAILALNVNFKFFFQSCFSNATIFWDGELMKSMLLFKLIQMKATMRNLRCERIVEQRVAAKELLVLPRARSTSAGVELAFKGILKFDAAQVQTS